MNTKMILAGAVMAVLSSGAIADTVDGTINFEGKIVNDSCKVSSLTGDAGTINVAMGTISADQIGTVAAPKMMGNGTGSANFDIDCKKGAKVGMKFAGQASELSADKKSIRVNNGATGAGFAQGVSVAVYEGTGAGTQAYDLSNGSLLAPTELKEAGKINVRFSAAYVAADPAKVTAGVANASLPFTLSYE